MRLVFILVACVSVLGVTSWYGVILLGYFLIYKFGVIFEENLACFVWIFFEYFISQLAELESSLLVVFTAILVHMGSVGLPRVSAVLDHTAWADTSFY
jgi:hypothetical protein